MNADKASCLEALAEAIRNLEKSPLYEFRQMNGYLPVIGEGAPDAHIMFVGEAPGEQEAKSGRSFVGNAGRVLDKLLASIGANRKDVYITNVVKDRPPGNRNPRTEEIRLYAPFLMRQIDIIQPAVIVTRHGQPVAVILSYTEYEEVLKLRKREQKRKALEALEALRDEARLRNPDLTPEEAYRLTGFSEEVIQETLQAEKKLAVAPKSQS